MNKNNSRTSSRQSTNESQAKLICRAPYYGDVLKKNKKSKNIRIVFQNINGIGTTKENDKKEILRKFINEYNVDCYAIAEVNINWKVVV